MRILLSKLAIIGTALFFSMPAMAVVLDDFNRPDSDSLGSNWSQITGSSSISSDKAQGSDLSIALFKEASGSEVSFDIFNIGTGIQYVAAVFGDGSASSYFIKVQNSGDVPGFAYYGFYRGNGNNNAGGPFGSLSASFSSGHVVVSVLNTLATLTITPDVGAMQVYSYDYGTAFNGNQIGLGFYGAAQADNFGNGENTAQVPEPTTVALLGLGLFGVATSRRKAARK